MLLQRPVVRTAKGRAWGTQHDFSAYVGHPTSTCFFLAQRWSSSKLKNPKTRSSRPKNSKCIPNEELVIHNHDYVSFVILRLEIQSCQNGRKLFPHPFTWLTKISISVSPHFFSHTGELGENAKRNPSLAKSLGDKQRWYSSFRRVREEDEPKSALLAEKTDLCTSATNLSFFQIQLSAIF